MLAFAVCRAGFALLRLQSPRFESSGRSGQDADDRGRRTALSSPRGSSSPRHPAKSNPKHDYCGCWGAAVAAAAAGADAAFPAEFPMDFGVAAPSGLPGGGWLTVEAARGAFAAASCSISSSSSSRLLRDVAGRGDGAGRRALAQRQFARRALVVADHQDVVARTFEQGEQDFARVAGTVAAEDSLVLTSPSTFIPVDFEISCRIWESESCRL